MVGVGADQGDAMIVRSTIDLARNLGLTVVAEGVESAAILPRLGELGCDEAQGYHMSQTGAAGCRQEWAARRAVVLPAALAEPRVPAGAERAALRVH